MTTTITKTKYMSNFEIQNMAEAALVSYEMTASWASATRAAEEYAADEWLIAATPSQVYTSVCLAKMGWEGVRMGVQTTVLNNLNAAHCVPVDMFGASQ